MHGQRVRLAEQRVQLAQIVGVARQILVGHHPGKRDAAYLREGLRDRMAVHDGAEHPGRQVRPRSDHVAHARRDACVGFHALFDVVYQCVGNGLKALLLHLQTHCLLVLHKRCRDAKTGDQNRCGNDPGRQ